VVLTTNKAFKEWNTVFPNATCIAALLDRLTHHADVTLIEGDSYRMRESQMEAEVAKKTPKGTAMPNDLETYRQTLLDLYLRFPDTPCRVSRHDLRLVHQLWERDIPLTTAETALLLASVRRAARRPDAIPLGSIRSLHYFLPVIEELFQTPLHHGDAYLTYLRSKVPLRPAAHRGISAVR
jgi:hypothetical protein